MVFVVLIELKLLIHPESTVRPRTIRKSIDIRIASCAITLPWVIPALFVRITPVTLHVTLTTTATLGCYRFEYPQHLIDQMIRHVHEKAPI
jgi:hypothetical protein